MLKGNHAFVPTCTRAQVADADHDRTKVRPKTIFASVFCGLQRWACLGKYEAMLDVIGGKTSTEKNRPTNNKQTNKQTNNQTNNAEKSTDFAWRRTTHRGFLFLFITFLFIISFVVFVVGFVILLSSVWFFPPGY